MVSTYMFCFCALQLPINKCLFILFYLHSNFLNFSLLLSLSWNSSTYRSVSISPCFFFFLQCNSLCLEDLSNWFFNFCITTIIKLHLIDQFRFIEVFIQFFFFSFYSHNLFELLLKSTPSLFAYVLLNHENIVNLWHSFFTFKVFFSKIYKTKMTLVAVFQDSKLCNTKIQNRIKII